jgi:hypothetical protein
MKAPLKPRAVTAARPDPAEVLRLAAEAAPHHPPAVATPMPSPAPASQAGGEGGSTTLNQRFRKTTVANLTAAAEARGLTMKQVVAQALQAAGVEVDPADLEDRTPRRKG